MMNVLIRKGFLCWMMLCLATAPAAADVFTVNVRSDDPDDNPGDGVCDTGSTISDEPACSLRAAIQEANALDGADTIEFNVLVATPFDIPVDSPLTVTGNDPLIIDGTTQNGYGDTPVIEINGTNAGTDADGFVIEADGVVIKGLSIIHFDGDGIQINSDQNVIGENYIGVMGDETAAGNGRVGIVVNGDDNIIGDDGTYETGGNVISNSTFDGIRVLAGHTGNTIQANQIGTDPSGTTAMGNGLHGVSLLNASSTTIGGTDASARNVISGNDDYGVQIDGTSGASNNTVAGNYIGIDANGTAALANGKSGIRIAFGASNNTVGGTSAGAGNVISGNSANGVLIESSGTTGNVVRGNYIGTNAAGNADLGNGADGIRIASEASDNTIGGTDASAHNVISGNGGNGVTVRDPNTTGNEVLGNYIGTDAAGTAALGNAFNGISVSFGASQNTVGGSASGAGNVIAGNGRSGIKLDIGDQNVIQGNAIGVDASEDPLANSQRGVHIARAVDNVIGGTDAGEGNVIAHNAMEGILLESSTSTAHGNAVRGNAIYANGTLGIDIDGDGQTANDAGDGDDGTNRLQNFPEIVEAEYNVHADQVSVTYRVPSDPSASGDGASAYPLQIDFYKVDADRQEGAVYLSSTSYSASAYDNGPDTFYGFTPPSGATIDRGDFIVATATDADGNTSEFSLPAALGPVFVVDDTGDAADSDTGDDRCDDGSGNCTLRAAIEQANATANIDSSTPDTIKFDIAGSGPHVIEPGSALPEVTEPVFIEGTTEPDYADAPVVVLDGVSAGANVDGLVVSAGNSRITGLAVVNFDGDGLVLKTNGTSTVAGCYVGIEPDGSAAGNGRNGIIVTEGSTDNHIGSTALGDGNWPNVIADNGLRGIYIGPSGADDNTVVNNLVGTDPAGTAAMGNSREGIIATSVTGTMIGGTDADARNVVVDNLHGGIKISGGSATIQGNAIGIDANGDPIGNNYRGVSLVRATGTVVGGTGAGEANTIAANEGGGVVVESGSSTARDNVIRGNAIYGNVGLGIDLDEDGVTDNDADDSDDGSNGLQNFPEIQSADYDADADAITVTYRVPSDPNASGDGASAYPLTIDFYQADDDGEEGMAWLGTDTYEVDDYTGGPNKTISFTPDAPVTQDDFVVATATDADGNTSEFSAQSQQLPVELAAFEATLDGEAVRLTWRTASETNNAGFSVQRRVDGAMSFDEVGFVEGRGTTAEAQTYRFEDADLPYDAEHITYRLEQVDTDGTAEHSPEVEVDLGTPETLTLHGNYPNPARTTTTIRYALPKAAPIHLALYDMLGRQVVVLVDGEQPAGRKEVTVDASTLPSGLYLYRLRAGTEVVTRRMTIVK